MGHLLVAAVDRLPDRGAIVSGLEFRPQSIQLGSEPLELTLSQRHGDNFSTWIALVGIGPSLTLALGFLAALSPAAFGLRPRLAFVITEDAKRRFRRITFVRQLVFVG